MCVCVRVCTIANIEADDRFWGVVPLLLLYQLLGIELTVPTDPSLSPLTIVSVEESVVRE